MQSESLTVDICRDFIETRLCGPAVNRDAMSINNTGCIGLELESFPVTSDAMGQAAIPDRDMFVNQLVEESVKLNGYPEYLGVQQEITSCRLINSIRFPDGSSFQFEPGGQVEISTGPCYSIPEVEKQIATRKGILNSLTQYLNMHFAQYGTNPWFTEDLIGIQFPKPRYRAMARYLDTISTSGRQMMVQTSSIQVNLDAGRDWDTGLKRIIAANLLAPFATAIFANSSVTAGSVNGYKSHRSFLWQHLDHSRTGLWIGKYQEKNINKNQVIEAYLNFALKAPVIFIEDFGDKTFPKEITLEYWMANGVNGLFPAMNHLKNHLSLLFPEVRLKGYLELRSPDALPPEWQIIPALFYCGLLYSGRQMERVLDFLWPHLASLGSLMQEAVFGLDSDRIFETSKTLFGFAIEGIGDLPESFTGDHSQKQITAFAEGYTFRRRTFADEYLERCRNKKLLVY